MKIQAGYRYRTEGDDPPTLEAEHEESPIVLIPDGCSRIKGALEVTYDADKRTWALRVNDGTLLIEPGGANSIRIKSDRRGL